MKNITTNAEIQADDMRVIGTRKIQSKLNGAKLDRHWQHLLRIKSFHGYGFKLYKYGDYAAI